MMNSPRRLPHTSRTASTAFFIGLTAIVVLLTGCGGEKKDKAASQTAAKVNKEEITVHQINFVLAKQRALPPGQAASAGRVVLQKLIDQEVALQKASEQKLDRDPRVVQQIEAARRDIISRAYLEKISQGAPKPTPAEVSAYYEAHPALFGQRRLYSLQELSVEATPEQVEAAKTALAGAKNFPEFVAYLKANNIRFAANEAVRSAEQLPLASVDKFATMKDGQTVFNTSPKGAQILHLAASRSQPIALQAAVPAIEQFLHNERKRKLVADDLLALRGAAKIEYVGDYAKDVPPPPDLGASAAEAPPLTSIAPAISSSGPGAAPQIEVAPTPVQEASMPSGSTLDKGLKGMR